ncbi:MAG: PIN domain-containing protein [Chitinophagales bacterium]|nr:PIN domain-containing protein [Chitinophagales bacterium]
MNTVSQNINKELKEIEVDLIKLLRSHSKIKRVIFPNDLFFLSSGDHGFEELNIDGIKLQNSLFKKLNKLSEIISVLIIGFPEKYSIKFVENKKTIEEYILQEGGTWKNSIEDVILDTKTSIENIHEIINQLFPSNVLNPIIIPDTNALYQNTEIEKWNFDETQKFTIIITPSVLKDLDKHKIEHRNESVRNKAQKLIKKLKEYRRRGKLTEGVIIVKNKIDLISIAAEPDFTFTLSWLDPLNDDDRLIAETIEIIRKHGNRPVILITSDINLQNKCELAQLSYMEPPLKN